MVKFQKGDHVKRAGYKPAFVVTGHVNDKNEVLVDYFGEGRHWQPISSLKLVHRP